MKKTLQLAGLAVLVLLQSNLRADPSSMSAYGFVIQFNEYCKNLNVRVNLRLDEDETVQNETHKREMFSGGESIALVIETNKESNALEQVVIFADLGHEDFVSINLIAIMTIEGRFFEDEEIQKYLTLLGFKDHESFKAPMEFASEVATYSKVYDDTYGYSLTINPKSN